MNDSRHHFEILQRSNVLALYDFMFHIFHSFQIASSVPYVIYSVEVWFNLCNTITNPLYMLHTKALRIINGMDYYKPTK